MPKSTPSSPHPTQSPQEMIFQAERQQYVGKFRVKLNQVLRHPHQRLLDYEWVSQLVRTFSEGMDKAAHPIKALVEDDSQWQEYMQVQGQPLTMGQVPDFPAGINLLVHHGQHRIEACRRLEHPDAAWWYVDVYRRELELNHPAEFLALMHAGNESHLRLETKDVDRVLGIYQLRCMLEKNTITPLVFSTNRDRLMGPDQEVRKGLLAISRDMELLKPIADAMAHPALHPAFNGASWRKLAKGRFYKAKEGQLSGCLVSEMEQQFRLLQDIATEVSSKPFLLQAPQCSLEVLAHRVKRKEHAWNHLPGGGQAALARVKVRPQGFSTPLNPGSSNCWTFPDTVLLPSVLTSATVTTSLQAMYELAQHLIHMIAGKEVLTEYMSTKPKEDLIHPANIIRNVLKGQINENGKRGYEHKVIFHMWDQRTVLKQELEDYGLPEASEVVPERYQELVNSSRGWWTLMRLFKRSKFTTGLLLSITKTFGGSEREKTTTPTLASPGLPAPGLNNAPPPRKPPSSRSHPRKLEDPNSQVNGRPQASAPMTGRLRDQQPETSKSPLLYSTGEPKPTPTTRTQGTKRHRSDSFDSVGEIDGIHGHSRRGLGTEDANDEGLACSSNRRLNLQLVQLANAVPSLNKDEAGIMAVLIEGLLVSKEKGILAKVAQGLVSNLPRLSHKAEKLLQLDFEMETEDEADGNTKNTEEYRDDDMDDCEYKPDTEDKVRH